MTSTALAPTLARPMSARQRELALAASGVLTIALAAQVVIVVPLTPVPISGQTLAVLLVGGALGARRGAAATAVYLGLGAAGAPFFADGSHGIGVLLSATGGYLVGMLAAAAVVGWAADRSWDRRLATSAIAMLVGSAIVYLVGASWLAVILGLDAAAAFDLGVAPFLLGDLLKLALAGALLPAAWRVVRWASDDRTTK